nr:hypothetical protein CFP56_00636 [Quercus suber]
MWTRHNGGSDILLQHVLYASHFARAILLRHRHRTALVTEADEGKRAGIRCFKYSSFVAHLHILLRLKKSTRTTEPLFIARIDRSPTVNPPHPFSPRPKSVCIMNDMAKPSNICCSSVHRLVM